MISQLLFELFKVGASGLVGFLVGNHRLKTEKRKQRIQTLGDNVILFARELANDAHSYLTDELTPRERNCLHGNILRGTKRVSTELNRLINSTGRRVVEHVPAHRDFYNAATAEPIGAEEIEPLNSSDLRVALLREKENRFIKCISQIVDDES